MYQHIHRIVFQASTLNQNTFSSAGIRCYARWINRNPSKVLLPFEPTTKPNLKKEKVISLDPEILNKSKEKQAEIQPQALDISPQILDIANNIKPLTLEKTKELKIKREDKLKKLNFYLNQKKVFGDNNEIIYEKLKENDARLSSLLVKLKSKKDRLRSGQILVEGWRLIVDGLEAKCKLKYVIFSRIEDVNNLRPFLPKTGISFYKIPYKEIELWSDVETSPGIFGIFEMPTTDSIRRLSKPIPLSFICDNIRVPGNLGAILRVAVGLGCEKVLLTKGCVDLWDSKVLRSAAGAHFRLPVHPSVDWKDIPNLLEKDTSIFIADSNAKILCEPDSSDNIDTYKEIQMPILPYYGVQYSSLKHITLVIGGETESISENSYMLAARHNGVRLNIPLQRGIDSLNSGMAAAVIAFEIRKQLIEAWTRAKIERLSVSVT